MTTLIIIIACVFIAFVILSKVHEYREEEYNHWCNKAMNDFNLTKAEFDNYIIFCKKMFNKSSPRLAYSIAEEEYFDQNYK